MLKTSHHSLGVRLEIESALDGSQTVIAAWQAERPGRYRVLIDDMLRGFVELTEDGWLANTIGDTGQHLLGHGDPADLDLACREAAEHFTGAGCARGVPRARRRRRAGYPRRRTGGRSTGTFSNRSRASLKLSSARPISSSRLSR
jgi:hypothetical protein